jgi:hypothetical protein
VLMACVRALLPEADRDTVTQIHSQMVVDRVCMHVYIDVCIDVHIQVSIYTHTYMCVCVYVCMGV